jgi:hypothetical protein
LKQIEAARSRGNRAARGRGASKAERQPWTGTGEWAVLGSNQ